MPHKDSKNLKTLVLTVGCINYDHDKNHFEPIKNLFSNTLRYDYFSRTAEIGRDDMNAELIQLVREETPDYVFFITYQNQVKLDTLTKIRATGSLLIGWFSDDQWRFDQYSMKMAKYLDFQVTTDRHAYTRYLELGFNPIHCQWGCNEHHYQKKKGLQKDIDVSFVGSRHGARKASLEQLNENGIKINGFGRDWGGRISFDEMISVFNCSKINLNLSNSSVDENIKQIKGRHFEVPMCGGFLLTDYVAGLEDYFIPGQEIETFQGIEEATDKINYYLTHDEDRETIADAGYRRAITSHTWEKRLRNVFDQIHENIGRASLSPRPGFGEQLINRLFKA